MLTETFKEQFIFFIILKIIENINFFAKFKFHVCVILRKTRNI